MTAMDIFQRDDLAFPRSLPEFQQRFPDDAACATYLERTRWPDGFVRARKISHQIDVGVCFFKGSSDQFGPGARAKDKDSLAHH